MAGQQTEWREGVLEEVYRHSLHKYQIYFDNVNEKKMHVKRMQF